MRRQRVLTLHVFEKVRALDLTMAEFERLLDGGEVIETTPVGLLEVKEVVLVLGWTRPLHAVVVVDDRRGEDRIVTVYEPAIDLWTRDFRERRRR